MNVCLLTKCTCTVKHCIQSHKIEVNAFESEKNSSEHYCSVGIKKSK